MRKIILILLLSTSYCVLYAQENAISISNLSVKNQLPPDIKRWSTIPASLLLVAQNNTWGDRQVRLYVAIKKGDSRICGNTDGIAVDYFKTRSFQTNDLLASLTNCETLQPGDYTLCTRFRGMGDNRQWVDISAEVCRPFTVGSGANAQTFSRPTITSPENNKVFTEQDFKKPLTFRWTPVVPLPLNKDVVYHLKIWQIPKGQTAMQVIKSTQPLVEKDIDNLTQASITTGLFPCAPNCHFAWIVEATDKEGKPYGENNGVSEPALFSVASADITITNFKINCGSSFGTYTFSLTATNYGNSSFSLSQTTPITFSSSAGTISGITITPSPANIIINPNGSAIFTGSFSYSGTYPAAIIATVSGTQTNNTNLPSTDTEVDNVLACVCTTCNLIQWQPGQAAQTLQGNSINIIQSFNPTGYGSIVAAKAEITSFERYVGDDCMSCNKDWNQWGNFTSGTYAGLNGSLTSATSPVTGFTHHTIYFAANAPGNFNLSISTPQLSNLSCCCDRVVVTIRYTYTFKQDGGTCIYCSAVKRYELQKGNCPPIPVPVDPHNPPVN
ncbi:MAG: hypothetical protein ABJB05_09325 [Parafilimonas sp.]